MMKTKYDVNFTDKNGFKEFVLMNLTSGDYLSVIPSAGCRLNQAVIHKNNKPHSVLRELSSPVMHSRDELFNNAKLFPFANRIEDGAYIFKNKSYALPVNYPEENNACHGLMFDRPFVEAGQDTEDGILKFGYDYEADKAGYPFRFSIYIKYQLTDEGEIICGTEVLNRSEDVIPFSDGWHPYFKLGNSIDNLSLKTEAERIIETDERGIPVESYLFVDDEYKNIELREKKMDTIFLLKENSKAVTKLYSAADDLTLCIWQESGKGQYRYLVVYTPEDRSSIAIEPMTSNVNAFNNSEDLIILPPGKTWTGRFGFFIK